MNGFKLEKNALIVAILSLLTAITWVGFEVYRVSMETTIPKVTQKQMLELDPNLDVAVLESLKNRLALPEDELVQTAPVTSQDPILEIEPEL